MYQVLTRHILNYNHKNISNLLIKIFGDKNKIKIDNLGKTVNHVVTMVGVPS